MARPIISWYDSTHSTQAIAPTDMGTIDAGDESNVYTFNIWNNRNGQSDVSKMEDCTITTRDMSGGTGDTVEHNVQSVRENWFHCQVDSLGETDLSEASSRIGATASKNLGTTGTTKHRKSFTQLTWIANRAYAVGESIKPTADNGFCYVVVDAGNSSATQPTWSTVEGTQIADGSVTWIAVKINHKPGAREIMGVANDGTPANSAGNFVTVSIQIEVPLSGDAGRQDVKLRVSFRYV